MSKKNEQFKGNGRVVAPNRETLLKLSEGETTLNGNIVSDDSIIGLLNALGFYADQTDHRKARQVQLDAGEIARKALEVFNNAQ